MRVTINPTFDMSTWTWMRRPSYEYCGPAMLFKGDKTAQTAEQTQAMFDQQLMNIFSAQYGKQSQVFDFLTGKMTEKLTNPTGYDPSALSAMRTSASDVNAQQTKNAQQAYANMVSARAGGSKLTGVAGNVAQGEADIAAVGASQEANSQNAITLANEQLRQQNYWNSVNVLSGQQAVANPLGYASGATSGSGEVSNLSGAVTAANGPTAGQILGGVVGGGLSAASSIFGGGFAKGGAFAHA